MSAVNKAILIGRLGADPEIRYTPSGVAVANFSVATSQSWKDKNTGEKKEATEWHRIVAWNKLAEICSEYLEKGRQVYIEGRMQTRSWEDKDGVVRYITEVVAGQVVFLAAGAAGSGGKKQERYRDPADYPESFGRTYPDYNSAESDDIPF